MPKRRIILLVLVAAALLVLAGVLVYRWGAPRLVQVQPDAGAQGIPAGGPVRLTFSRQMQSASVEKRLSLNPAVQGQFTWEGQTLVFTPSQPWPSGGTVQVRLEKGGLAAGFLSLPIAQDNAWSFEVSAPRLAYLFPSSGPAGLYSLDLTTGEIQTLVPESENVLDFDIGSTGIEIYYTDAPADGSTVLHRLNVLQGEDRVLLACDQALCRAGAISPKGDFLAYERTALDERAATQVWLLPLENGKTGTPFPAGDAAHQTQSPHWSPTGLLTYYNFSLSSFVVQDPRFGQIARFPGQTGMPGDWDGQGEHYVFPEVELDPLSSSPALTDVVLVSSSHLLRFRLDGSFIDLTQSNDVEDASPAFSPDGSRIAFGRKFLDPERWSYGRQLWLVNADGSGARQATNDPPYNHYDFAWSPDGAWLAYARFNKDRLTDLPELWLANADGSQVREIIKGGYAPQWIP
jgi:hypothetical protein